MIADDTTDSSILHDIHEHLMTGCLRVVTRRDIHIGISMRIGYCAYALALVAILAGVQGFAAPNNCNCRHLSVSLNPARQQSSIQARGESVVNAVFGNVVKTSATLILAAFLSIGSSAIAASDSGASLGANAKITTGGASTLQSGRTISITRGVNLDNSNFAGQNLKGVAFQQSIVRDSSFKGSNLVGASFFDATVDGTDFEGADMTLANVEMAQFNRANLKV